MANQLGTLAIDTSGSLCSVAIKIDGEVFSLESDRGNDHFERLSSLVSELLDLAQVSSSQLGQIVIGIGPGSFTGLRIGLSFAKGLSVALRVPILGLSSFAGAARAYVSLEASGRLLVVGDARRQEVFAAEYLVQADGLAELSAPKIEPSAFISEWIGRYPEGVVVTPNIGLEAAQSTLVRVESRIAKGLLDLDNASIQPFSIASVASLEPNYLRAVAAKSIAERIS